MSLPRVLFILKKRGHYDWGYCGGTSSGLYNSAWFIVEKLLDLGFPCKIAEVVDNNDIDREVTAFKPNFAIIEALWVVPEKFEILHRLHPSVHWVVRIHSDTPFLSNEGVAIDWLVKYLNFGVDNIAGNSKEVVNDLKVMIRNAYREWPLHKRDHRVVYLPNYYPIHDRCHMAMKRPDSFLDVGCFGAIRPMKNQLIQAVAAVDCANRLKKKLRFHINSTRVETGGESALKNLKSLMIQTGNELVEHEWVPHCDFMQVLTSMDIGMQVSFSETFNIVAADMVAAGLPIVVSPEVHWAVLWSQADPNDSKDIAECMLRALNWKWDKILKAMNLASLKEFVHEGFEHWITFLDRESHEEREHRR